jgi:hypothetical protein
LAQKVVTPHKIFLIRGNHEVRDVNGDFQVYGKTSFLYQCTELLGTVKGKKVWEVFNNCFDQMPISAILDQKVFCVHGGVPRQLMRARERILQEIDHIPKVASCFPIVACTHELTRSVSCRVTWTLARTN